MTHTIQSLRSRIDRRMAILASLLAGLLGTGVMTMAQIADTTTVTNSFQTLTLDLQSSADGTTFANTTTLNWTLEGTTQVNKVVHLKNTGNGAAQIVVPNGSGYPTSGADIVWTATGDATITGALFNLRSVATAGACPATGTVSGTAYTTLTSKVGPSSGAGNWANGNPTITINPGETHILCMSVKPEVNANGSATQTITIEAASGL